MLPGHGTLNNRMGSTGHKANVPDKDFREIGIWAAKGTHKSWATRRRGFGARASAGIPTNAGPTRRRQAGSPTKAVPQEADPPRAEGSIPFGSRPGVPELGLWRRGYRL